MISDIRATRNIKGQWRLKLQHGEGVQSMHTTWYWRTWRLGRIQQDVMSIQRIRLDSRLCITSLKKRPNMKKTEKPRNFSHFPHQPGIPFVPRTDVHGDVQTHNSNATLCVPASSIFLLYYYILFGRIIREKMG